MGSAFKNKGVQLLLDGVEDYLPCPTDVVNSALDIARDEEKVRLQALGLGRCWWCIGVALGLYVDIYWRSYARW